MEKFSIKRVNRDHREFIGQLPCVKCATLIDVQAAHVRIGTDGGTGLKPSDCYTVPLCESCHLTGPEAQHRGERTFWAKLKIDPKDLALRLFAISGDLEAGMRIVRIARLGQWKNS